LPDYALFSSLPGAGPTFAPRLLAAFGEQRERYARSDEIQQYAGIAPVTERSGNKSWVHWRLQCPKFLRQTFVEWAALSIPHCYWAKAYYEQQRARGRCPLGSCGLGVAAMLAIRLRGLGVEINFRGRC